MIKKLFNWIKSKFQSQQIEEDIDEAEVNGWPRDIAISQLHPARVDEVRIVWKDDPKMKEASRAISKILWGYEEYYSRRPQPINFLDEVHEQIKNLKEITPELQKVLKELVEITKEYFPEKDVEKMAKEVISKLRR